METGPNLDALADRLREVRRQLSRSVPLANVLDRQEQSAATLRAVQRLEAAVIRLEEESPSGRLALRKANAGLPWLIRVIERRAEFLEKSLAASANLPTTAPPSEPR